eukprot:4074369-Amphidinium_carterae.1
MPGLTGKPHMDTGRMGPQLISCACFALGADSLWYSELLEKAIAMKEAAFGPNHPEVPAALRGHWGGLAQYVRDLSITSSPLAIASGGGCCHIDKPGQCVRRLRQCRTSEGVAGASAANQGHALQKAR